MWAILLIALAGLALAQLTNFNNSAVQQGSVTNMADFRNVLSQPGTLHIVTPEATNWSFYLAQVHQPHGPTLMYVHRPEGRRLCEQAAGDYGGTYGLIRVLATEERPRPVAFILPPADSNNLSGTLLEGDGLYREMILLDLPNPMNHRYNLIGPKRGFAQVRGNPYQPGGLTAEVYLREVLWEQDSLPSEIGAYNFGHPWDGVLSVDLGRGAETLRVQGYNLNNAYQGTQLRMVDASGADVGYVVLSSETTWVNLGVDTSRTSRYEGRLDTFTFDPGTGAEVFRSTEYAASCGLLGCTWRGYHINDLQGRYRGWGEGWQCGASWCQAAYIHPLKLELRKQRENITLYARRWRQVERDVYKGLFAVGVQGHLTVEGQRYSIPELASYGLTSPASLSYSRGSPVVAYLARQIGIEDGSHVNNRLLGGLNITPPERPKPLADFCRR